MKRSVVGSVMAMTIAGAAILVGGTPARADYFAPWYADGTYHDFWYSSATLGSTRYAGAANARITSVDAGTDITTAQVTVYLPTTDVAVIMDTNTIDVRNAYAWTTCSKGSSICDAFVVHTSKTNLHPDYYALYCHEFGHTLGLQDGEGATYGHNSDSLNYYDRSCMRSGPDVQWYSNHDKTHINGRY